MASSLPSLRILIRLATMNSSRPQTSVWGGCRKPSAVFKLVDRLCRLKCSWIHHMHKEVRNGVRDPITYCHFPITPEVCKKTNSSDYVPYLCHCAWRWTMGILVNCIKDCWQIQKSVLSSTPVCYWREKINWRKKCESACRGLRSKGKPGGRRKDINIWFLTAILLWQTLH